MADSGSSPLFQTYENSYCQAATGIAEGLVALSGLPADQRKQRIKDLEKDIKEAEQILQRLDMEARSFSPDKSRPLLKKVKDYKTDLLKLKQDVGKAATGGPSGGADSRAELGLMDDYYQTSAGQRERLLTATERLDKTSDRITQGRQQLLETEATGHAVLAELQRQRETIHRSKQETQRIDESVQESQGELGVQILTDLHRQRESILHSRDTLQSVDVNIGRARQVLASMSRRITQNKVIMWGVILLLAGMIGLVLWSKIMN